jgi:hypothetical protein
MRLPKACAAAEPPAAVVKEESDEADDTGDGGGVASREVSPNSTNVDSTATKESMPRSRRTRFLSGVEEVADRGGAPFTIPRKPLRALPPRIPSLAALVLCLHWLPHWKKVARSHGDFSPPPNCLTMRFLGNFSPLLKCGHAAG